MTKTEAEKKGEGERNFVPLNEGVDPYKVFPECQREDRYGHEKCPGWLWTPEPYNTKHVCECGCHGG